MLHIVTAHFDYPGVNKYARCLTALRQSIKENCPEAEFTVLELRHPEPITGVYQGWVNNHVKLQAYSDIPIDRDTVFIDSDTLVLRDLSEVFVPGFDVGIAKRPESAKKRAIFNGGVVLFRPTKAARRFMAEWIKVDTEMIYDQKLHMQWHAKYKGQNQASFGMLYETMHGVRIREFPTAKLNACEQDWPMVSTHLPYVLHVRKRLLAGALSHVPADLLAPRLRDAATIWRNYECRGR
jgi:hypothetical protein